MAQFLAGNFLLVGCKRNSPSLHLSLWDLSLVPVFHNDEDSVAASTPQWCEAMPDMVQYWPEPWVVDDVVYQILPKSFGMMIMALPLASTTTSLPPISLSVFEPEHKHSFLSFSSSRGFLAYTDYDKIIPTHPSRKAFNILRIHHLSNRPSFTLQGYDIPFRPTTYPPALDMYMSRLVFYSGTHVHLCSLSDNY